MADTTALKNRIRAAIKANDNQEITGPVLQQALLDMVDELNGATETEASARQSGDNTLQQSINTERQARIDADNALGQRITNEEQAREEAFDDLDIIDAAGSQVSPEAIDLTLRKNDGSDEDPEWRTLCHLLIPSATNQRAGLMSAAMRNLLYNLRNAGYAFGGIAVTATNPGVPSGNCFYIVRGAGTYTHFKDADNDSIIIENDGIYVFTYESIENHYWEWNLVIGIDSKLIPGSDNLVKSGEVASMLITFDALIHNYYRAPVSGAIYNHTTVDYFITEPIFLPNGSKIKIYNTSSNVLPLCKVDKNNVYISTLIDVDSDVREYIATEDMFVSYSSLYVSEVSFPVIEYKYSLPVNLTEIEKKIKNNADNIDDIQEETDDIQEETEDIKEDIAAANVRIDNKVDKSPDLRNILNPERIHWGGIWQNNSYRAISNIYGYSDLILCEYPQKLTAYRALSDGGNVTFAVYNVNKEYLRDVKVNSGGTDIATFEPQVGDAFIRINFAGSSSTNHHANYGDTLNDYTPYNNNPIYGYLNETVYEELDSLDERITDLEDANALIKDQYKALFNSVLCIGDSMTAGFRKNLGDLPNYSYPKFMSRISGWEVENAGNGGQTPRGWWTNKFGLYTYTDYEIAIIYLGQNEGLTDTLETDVDPYSNYHDYADTNTGCYCKIIEGILEENPNLKIFLLSGTAASDWSTGTTGTVINKIAQKYSLPVFNIKTNPWIDLSLNVYHPDISSGTTRDIIHYGTMGYLSLGRVIYNYIINYISEHETEFSSWPYSPQS